MYLHIHIYMQHSPIFDYKTLKQIKETQQQQQETKTSSR